MNEHRTGKPSPARLSALLGSQFGALSDQVLLGPGPGLDAAVVDLKDGRVMAIAEDPIFPAPGLPLDLMGWFTVHIGASDVAVTGIPPRFMTYSLLLPPPSPERDAKTIIESISKTASELGITIAGGHTGWYSAVTVPIVGGVTVWGFAERSAWISPAGARDGDILLMTKGPAIEAAALLSVVHKDRIGGRISSESLNRAMDRVYQISVVKDALTAFAAGDVHAMHDATEGGVIGGTCEMAKAAGIPAHINLDAVDIPRDIAEVADALAFDPWQAISEGTLLASVPPESVPRIRNAWAKAGIESHELGFFNKNLTSSTMRRNGRTTRLIEPEVDPFWELFLAPPGHCPPA
jgi:hydrogenase expression/formation protein HypE